LRHGKGPVAKYINSMQSILVMINREPPVGQSAKIILLEFHEVFSQRLYSTYPVIGSMGTFGAV
jgi:hypothetical protein